MSYEIVPARLEHVRAMVNTMRPMDRAEIEGWGLTPRRVLHCLYRDLFTKKAALVDGETAAIWGIQGSALSDFGMPWAFTAPPIERAKMAFYRETHREIAEMLVTRRSLKTYVLASYDASRQFFGRFGFRFGPPEPLGQNGTPYQLMTLNRPDPDRRPFLICALPRSRTYWLSRLLSYGDWTCHHEAAVRMRSINDAVEFFDRPRSGSAETGVSPGWKLLRHYVPDLRTVVVRRPVEDVVDAMMAVDVSGVATYDREKLTRNMRYMDRALDRIAACPDVLTVQYADLDQEETCAAVFSHCLPHALPSYWWNEMRGRNLQTDVRRALHYYHANRAAIDRFKASCKTELWRLARLGLVT